MIEADKGRIFQLLDNLISNAIKFTPDGGRIDVRVAPRLDGAVIEVSDTGIGLAPGEAELVFDRFFRVDRGRSRSRCRAPGSASSSRARSPRRTAARSRRPPAKGRHDLPDRPALAAAAQPESAEAELVA